MESNKVPNLSLDIINDALEYHSDVIVNGYEDGDVNEHWKSLRYFWKISQDQQIFRGRIFHRCRLAELVYYGCHLSPYGDLADTANRGNFVTQDSQQAMVYWTRSDWESLQKKLTRLCLSCKRQDANETVRSWDEERPQDHPRAQDLSLFGNRIKHLVDHIIINKHLSLIRLQMEQWIHSERRKEPHMDGEDMKEFWEEVEQLESQDKKKHAYLKQFLTHDSTRKKPMLAPMADLRGVLKETPCNLEALQAELLSVAMDWNRALFDDEKPALASIGYGKRNSDDMEEDESKHGVNESGEEDEIDDNRHDADSHYERGARQDDDNNNNSEYGGDNDNGKEIHHMRQARDCLRRAAMDPLNEACETAGCLQPNQIKQEPESSSHGEDMDGNESDTTRGSSSKGKSHQKKRRRESREVLSGDDDESEHTEQSSNKPKSRRYQRQNIGRHDSDEEDAASERSSLQRRRSRDRRSKKRSGSGNKIRFDSDDDDDDVLSVRISDLPRFREATPTRQKQRRRSRDNRKGPNQRKFFTAEEKHAIREGVHRFGHGRWIDILNEYSDVLMDRTNVQIKDCARTMQKNGEL